MGNTMPRERDIVVGIVLRKGPDRGYITVSILIVINCIIVKC